MALKEFSQLIQMRKRRAICEVFRFYRVLEIFQMRNKKRGGSGFNMKMGCKGGIKINQIGMELYLFFFC